MLINQETLSSKVHIFGYDSNSNAKVPDFFTFPQLFASKLYFYYVKSCSLPNSPSPQTPTIFANHKSK